MTINRVPKVLSDIGHLRELDLTEHNCAIYFLVRAGEVVYVGQSVNPHVRINQHRTEAEKDFDSAFIKPCPRHEMDNLESHFIHRYKPEYNFTSTNGVKLSPVRPAQLPRDINYGAAPIVVRRAYLSDQPAETLHVNGALLKRNTVVTVTGLSYSTIMRKVDSGEFPKPIKMGLRCTRWKSDDVRKWCSERI